MKPRRFILKVIVLLIAGATLNVAVAWGCGSFLGRIESHVSSERRPEFVDWYTANVPSNFPDPSIMFGPSNGNHVLECVQVGLLCDHVNYSGNDWPITEKFEALRIRAGFPSYSLHGECWWHQSPTGICCQKVGAFDFAVKPGVIIPIPHYPLWPGFAVNTLFYAGVLWVLFCGPFALRRMIRRRRGQCPHCAYPIGQSPVCTECGESLGKGPLAVGNGDTE